MRCNLSENRFVNAEQITEETMNTSRHPLNKPPTDCNIPQACCKGHLPEELPPGKRKKTRTPNLPQMVRFNQTKNLVTTHTRLEDIFANRVLSHQTIFNKYLHSFRLLIRDWTSIGIMRGRLLLALYGRVWSPRSLFLNSARSS